MSHSITVSSVLITNDEIYGILYTTVWILKSGLLPHLTLRRTLLADAGAVAPHGTAEQICMYDMTGTMAKSGASLRIVR